MAPFSSACGGLRANLALSHDKMGQTSNGRIDSAALSSSLASNDLFLLERHFVGSELGVVSRAQMLAGLCVCLLHSSGGGGGVESDLGAGGSPPAPPPACWKSKSALRAQIQLLCLVTVEFVVCVCEFASSVLWGQRGNRARPRANRVIVHRERRLAASLIALAPPTPTSPFDNWQARPTPPPPRRSF